MGTRTIPLSGQSPLCPTHKYLVWFTCHSSKGIFALQVGEAQRSRVPPPSLTGHALGTAVCQQVVQARGGPLWRWVLPVSSASECTFLLMGCLPPPDAPSVPLCPEFPEVSLSLFTWRCPGSEDRSLPLNMLCFTLEVPAPVVSPQTQDRLSHLLPPTHPPVCHVLCPRVLHALLI